MAIGPCPNNFVPPEDIWAGIWAEDGSERVQTYPTNPNTPLPEGHPWAPAATATTTAPSVASGKKGGAKLGGSPPETNGKKAGGL